MHKQMHQLQMFVFHPHPPGKHKFIKHVHA